MHTVKEDFFLIDKSFVNRVMHRKGYIFFIFLVSLNVSLCAKILKRSISSIINVTPHRMQISFCYFSPS